MTVIDEDYRNLLAGNSANLPADRILTGDKLKAEKKKRTEESREETEVGLAMQKKVSACRRVLFPSEHGPSMK